MDIKFHLETGFLRENPPVVDPIQRKFGFSGGVGASLFAYNEFPTIAVAIACWSQARHESDAPFF